MFSVQQKARWFVALSQDTSQPRVVVDPGLRRSVSFGNRDISIAVPTSRGGTASGRPEAKPTMSAREKSDLPIVAKKRANKAASAAAELVERRGGAKEKAELQSTVRAQSREVVSQAQARTRESVIRNRQDKLTALLHHFTIDVLRASFFGLKKSTAPGVDEMTWTEYVKGLRTTSRISTLAFKRGSNLRPYRDLLHPARECHGCGRC